MGGQTLSSALVYRRYLGKQSGSLYCKGVCRSLFRPAWVGGGKGCVCMGGAGWGRGRSVQWGGRCPCCVRGGEHEACRTRAVAPRH